MNTRTKITLAILASALLLWGAQTAGSLDVTDTLTAKIVSFGSSTSTQPHKTGTTLPATCSVGQTFFKSDATAGQNVYGCTATDTWTQLGGSGGAVDYSNPANYPPVIEDFANGTSANNSVGTYGWSSSSLASGSVDVNSTPLADVPGYAAGVAHSTNADSAGIFTLGSVDPSMVVNYNWTWKARVKLASTSNSRTWIGIGATASIVPARFLGFRYDTSSSYTDDTKSTTGRWVAQMCVSSGCTDTGGTYKVTTVQPNTSWHVYEITKVSSTYTMKIDGTQVATFCASGCDATVTAMNGNASTGFFLFGFESGASFTASYADWYYWSYGTLTR